MDVYEKLANAIEASHEIIEAHYPRDGIRSDSANSSYFNGWYITDKGVLEHGGWNPTFKAQVRINRDKGIAVFTDCNSTANTQWYAMSSCYGELTDNHRYTHISRSDLYNVDIIASVLSLIIAVLLLLAVVMLLTQKKRLAHKTTTLQKEKRLLFARLVPLILLLCIALILPYIFGTAMEYPGFGYEDVWVWGGQSAVVMALLLDVTIITMIISVIIRYIRST